MYSTNHLRFLCAVALAFLLLAWGSHGGAHEGHQPLPTRGLTLDIEKGYVTLSRQARELLDLKTSAVTAAPISNSFQTSAEVVSSWRGKAFASSILPGRIVSLLVTNGQHVSQGDPLGFAECLGVQELEFELRKAQDAMLITQRQLDTIEPLAKSGAVAGQKLIEAENLSEQARNNFLVLQAKIRGLGLSLDQFGEQTTEPLLLPIRSPIDGFVQHTDVTVGSSVDQNQHLFEIADNSEVWLKLNILEKDLGRAQPGMRVTAHFGDQNRVQIETIIDRISLELDPRTGVGAAWCTIKNNPDSPAILPGMRGEAFVEYFAVDGKPVVPNDAIFSDGAERFVFVEVASTESSSELRKRPVLVGHSDSGQSQILGGDLYQGDQIVTQGGRQLSNLFFSGVIRLSPETAKGIKLEVNPFQPSEIQEHLDADGYVEIHPNRRAAISTQLGGTVEKIYVERSEHVSAGTIVAEVRSLALQELQVDLIRATLEAKLLRRTLQRFSEAKDSIPAKTIFELETRLKTEETGIEVSRQKLISSGFSTEQVSEITEKQTVFTSVPIRAQIDGSIVNFERLIGETVLSTDQLGTLHDLRNPRAVAWLNDSEVSKIRFGHTVRVRTVSQSERLLQGKVIQISPTLDSEIQKRAVWIEVETTDSQALLDRSMLSLQVLTGNPVSILSIPRSAVIEEQGRTFVFVQSESNRFERRPVSIGRRDWLVVEVTSGLEADEMVATSGVQQLQAAYAALR